MIDSLQEMVKNNATQYEQKNCKLNFEVSDDDEYQINLNLTSSAIKVNPADEFLNNLKLMVGVSYKLN